MTERTHLFEIEQRRPDVIQDHVAIRIARHRREFPFRPMQDTHLIRDGFRGVIFQLRIVLMKAGGRALRRIELEIDVVEEPVDLLIRRLAVRERRK